MKIALLGQTLNTNFKSKLSGGIQASERLHAELLTELGHDVTFIAPSDTEDIFPNVIRYSSPSEEGARAVKGDLTKFEKGNLNREKVKELKAIFSENKFDLVLIHAFQSSYTRFGAEISSEIPVVHVLHNNPENANDIGIFARADHYKRIYQNGGAIVCVTPYSRDRWRDFVTVRSASEKFSFLRDVVPEVDRLFKHTTAPVFTEAHPVLPSAGHGILITRPDPVKNPHGLLEALKPTQLKLKLYLAYPGDLSSCEYYVKKMQPLLIELGSRVELYQNTPRDQLLADLHSAAFSFVPCPTESASIVAIEAGSRGVPTIAFAKNGKHAAASLLSSSSLELVDSSDPQLSRALNRSYASREEIAASTVAAHGRDQRKQELTHIINSVTAKGVKSSLLEF